MSAISAAGGAAGGIPDDPTGVLRLTRIWKPALTVITVLLGAVLLTVMIIGILLPAAPLRSPLLITSFLLLGLTGRALWLVRRGLLKRTINTLVIVLLSASSVAVYLVAEHGPPGRLAAVASSLILAVLLSGLAPGRMTLAWTTVVSVAVLLQVLLLVRPDPLEAGFVASQESVPAVVLVMIVLLVIAFIMDRVGMSMRQFAAVLAGHERIRAALNQRIASKTRDRMTAEAVTVHALESERAARARLERINHQQTFLTDLGLLLTSDLDRGDWLDRLPSLLVPRLAVWSALYLLDEQGLLFTAAVAAQAEDGATTLEAGPEVRQAYPLPRVLQSAAEGSAPIIIKPLQPAPPAESTADSDRPGVARKPDSGSEVLIPLRTHGKVVGILTLASQHGTSFYDHDQQRFLIDIGRQAALAIDNAHLYHSALELSAELEHRVAQRTAELEAVNAELEAFTYSASHDLRGPLRGIDGFSQALVEDYGDRLDATALGYIERIRRGAARMGELIDDLLSLSRVAQGPLHPVPTDLGKLARQVFDELQELDPDREAKLVLRGNLLVVADARLLQIVLQNLLANSWKFSKRDEPTVITVGVRRQDGKRVYFVQDNGVGFNMDYAAKLFMPFQRLHRPDEFEGSGIGLATVQRIIRRHGGRIWAEASVGDGATFSFTLPEDEGA